MWIERCNNLDFHGPYEQTYINEQLPFTQGKILALDDSKEPYMATVQVGHSMALASCSLVPDCCCALSVPQGTCLHVSGTPLRHAPELPLMQLHKCRARTCIVVHDTGLSSRLAEMSCNNRLLAVFHKAVAILLPSMPCSEV